MTTAGVLTALHRVSHPETCDICTNKLDTRAKSVLGWRICGALSCRLAAVKRGQA